ncbi:MAG TPA: hypothetical protein VNQ74_02360, partial [Burkholderiaceae bacterium]|nr:hypothetical protein [Burkholderiaceae bacterium]
MVTATIRIDARVNPGVPAACDGVDGRYLRLTMIGALSWSLFWFKKERDSHSARWHREELNYRGAEK